MNFASRHFARIAMRSIFRSLMTSLFLPFNSSYVETRLNGKRQSIRLKFPGVANGAAGRPAKCQSAHRRASGQAGALDISPAFPRILELFTMKLLASCLERSTTHQQAFPLLGSDERRPQEPHLSNRVGSSTDLLLWCPGFYSLGICAQRFAAATCQKPFPGMEALKPLVTRPSNNHQQ